MNHVRIRRIFRASLVFALVLTSFVWSGLAAAAPAAHGGNRIAGAVYALTNAPTGNEVVVWNRADDGSLTPAGSYATGGLGSGAGLGSQGAIILSEDNRWLFAVNAGSNDISSFQVEGQGLKLISRVASGGTLPTSLTVYDDLLYVLNAGGSGNITGFVISWRGRLAQIAELDAPAERAGNRARPGVVRPGWRISGGDRERHQPDRYL